MPVRAKAHDGLANCRGYHWARGGFHVFLVQARRLHPRLAERAVPERAEHETGDRRARNGPEIDAFECM